MADRQNVSSQRHLVVLSTSGSEQLTRYADRLARWAARRAEEERGTGTDTLARCAHTLWAGRQELGERLALVASSLGELAELLGAFAADPEGAHGLARGSAAPGRDGPAASGGPEELARLWVAGATVDWRRLYPRPRPARLSLPVPPAATREYWVAEPQPRPAVGPAAHPLLAEAVDAEGQEFAVTLTGDEFFLRDHAIGEVRLLPAVAALELAAATAARTGRGRVRTLTDVLWARPITVTDEPVRVRLRLNTSPDGVSYEVDRGEEGAVCSLGRIGFDGGEPADEELLDLSEVRARCSRTVTGEECYALFDRLGGGYGPSFRPLHSLVCGENEALARLEVPEAVGLPHEQFTLHPSLLDGMLQAALWSSPAPEATTERQLPFSLASLELVRPLPTRGYVHAVRATGSPATAGHDLTLTDDAGRVALRLRGLVTRKVGGVHELRPAEREAASGTFAFEEVWQPSPPGEARQADGAVLVVGADSALGARLVPGTVEAVRPGSGLTAEQDGGWRLRWDEEEDWAELFGRLKEEGRAPTTIVWDAAAFGDEGPLDRPLLTLAGVFRAWSRARFEEPVRLLYVYEAAGGLDAVRSAALDGLARTVANEQPGFLMSTVAVPPASTEESARLVAAEVAAADHAFAVAHRDGERRTACWRRLDGFPSEGAGPALREGGTYLVTGGLGGLGRILVRHLAARRRVRFVLTGRSPLDEHAAQHLARLREEGVDAVYRRADLSEPGAAEALAEWIGAEFGALHGVLHLAGVVRDGYLVRKSAAEMAEVVAAKVSGTVALDRATAELPLDFFVVFSSVSGAAGSPGQADYAYANRFLDFFADRREELRRAGRRSGRSLSLLWSLWEEGGMRMGVDRSTQDRMTAEKGLRPITTAEGLAAFDAAFDHPPADGSRVLVAAGDGERIGELLEAASHRRLGRKAAQRGPGGGDEVRTPRESAESHLSRVLADVFEMPADEIEPETAFEAYGIDSILIMDLNSKLEEDFGPLPKTLFFEYQDLRSLAGYFAQRHGERLAALASDEPADGHRPELPETGPAPAPAPAPVPEEPRGRSTGAAEPIAIVGVSARFAGSDDLAGFWRNLSAGRNLITEIPPERWDWREYENATEADRAAPQSRWGSFLDGIDRFDPLFFGISPREAEIIDPQERLFLQTAWHTLEDAGYARAALRSARVGVYVGAMYGLYQLYEGDDGRIAASSYASIANRVSYTMGFSGPSLTLDSMCSSALSAIHLALRDLRSGDAEVALAGGVNLHVHPYKYRFLGQGRFTSSDGLCRSFGDGGDGYVPGEGVGAVLLKPLSSALRDGDHVYATVLGSALNHGGRTNGFTVPNPVAQGELIGRAVEDAGVDPSSLSYVEAHGTGTALGDPVEIRGLGVAFDAAGLAPGSVPIGSVKSNVGHLESAAGMAALCKVLLQMKHRTLVPSLHSETLNANIDWADSPFSVQRESAPWLPAEGGPLRAGISSFGAGGSNAHLVVEEHPPAAGPADAEAPREPRVFPFSAKTPERLRELARRFAEFLETDPHHDPAAVAYTLQVGREALDERLAVVASSTEELLAALTACAADRPLPSGARRDSVRSGSRDRAARVSRDEVEEAVERRDAEALAALWVRGGAPHWERLHRTAPGRVPLPGYPFEELRCWITEGDTLAPPPGGAAPSAGTPHGTWHPWLDGVDAAASLDGTVTFAARFTEAHPVIDDHRVAGVPLLPGVAVLELARAAVREAGLPERLVLRRVRWLRPLTVQSRERAAHLSLRTSGEALAFTLRDADAADANAAPVLAQGTAEPLPAGAEEEPLSIGEIERRCPRRFEGDRLYEEFAAAGLVYGPTLRGVEWAAAGEGEALARLAAPLHAHARYALDPALLDGALHAFAVLRDRESGRPMVPYAVEAVEIHRAAVDGYAHIRATGPDRYDVTLLDEEGRICVRLRALALRPAFDATEDAPPAEPARYDGSDLLDGLLFVPRWRPLRMPAGGAAMGGSTWIVHDAGTLPLAEELAARSDGSVLTPVERLASLDGQVPPETVYFVAGSARAGTRHDDAADLEESQQRGVLALFGLARSLLASGGSARPLRLVVVTEDVCDVAGGPARNPFAGSLHGLAQSLAQECANWQVSLLDCAADEEPRARAAMLERLVAAGTAVGAQGPLVVRGGAVHGRKLEPLAASPVAPGRIRRHGVYLLLGGAGGIGLEMTEWLVREFEAKVVLVGRSALDEERAARLRRIDPHGDRVRYARADAGDAAELERVVEEITRDHGALHGVVHSTIVLRDRSTANMDEATFRAALEAKTRVSVALLAALRSHRPDFVLFFSSAVALSGSAGQGNYAAGSSFEDAFAHFLQDRLDTAVRVINWGFWGTVGAVAQDHYRQRLARSGIFSLDPAEGSAAVDQVLAREHRQVLVTKASRDVLTAAGVDFTGTAGGTGLALLDEAAAMPPVPPLLAGEVAERLDRVMLDWLWLLFRAEGVFGAPEERWTEAELAARLRVVPARRRLFAELVRALTERGRLRDEDGLLVTGAPPAIGDPERELVELCARTDALEGFERLLGPCMHHLFRVMRGEVRATDVLFPSGSTALVEGAYRGSPVVDRANELTASAVARYLAERAGAAGEPLTVLEVGAGTGGTTAAVLPVLAEAGSPVRYVYTDLSVAFLQHGRERFAERYPFVEFTTLDAGRDPREQGLPEAGFDVVVAANVLHATEDLLATLGHVGTLLRPGGWLVLNEASSNVLTTTLTFGLLDGWWLNKDAHLRLPGSPLLSGPGWQEALAAAGFAGSRVLPADEGESQCVVVAEAARRELPAAPGPAAGPAAPAEAAPAAVGWGGDALRAAVEEYVRRPFREILHIADERLFHDETFENFGVDSLTTPRIADELAPEAGTSLPATLLFEYPTIGQLVDYFLEHHAEPLRTALLPEPDAAGERPTASDPGATAGPRPAPETGSPAAVPEDAWQPVAVIGMAGRYPGARNLDAFWENLSAGVDCVREVPPERWDWRRHTAVGGAAVSRWGGFLDGIDEFDPRFFQMSRKEAEVTDPQERLFLQTAWHTLEDAGYPRARLRGARVATYVGVMYGHYQLYENEEGVAGGMGYASIANRVSYLLGLEGPSLAVDSMCSSSLSAIHLACGALMLGDAEYALAGGVNLAVHPRKYDQLAVGGFTSSDGRCRSFGAGGDGMVPGEGVGALLLKPLALAERDGDRIHAVIRGSALNHGGRTSGYAVPNPVAQGELISQAVHRARIDPDTLSYVEAHGTGTALGDPAEMAGLVRGLGERGADAPDVALGSLKSSVGHLESAAGVAAVTKVLLQMRHGELVPSLHAEQLNPRIDWESVPFRVQRERAAWRRNGAPLRAGVSAFGAGGSNAHLVLEEYAAPAPRRGEDRPRLFVLSARTRDRLREVAADLCRSLDRGTADAEAPGLAARLAADLADLAGAAATPEEPLVELGLDLIAVLDLVRRVAERHGLDPDRLGPGDLHELLTLRQVAEALAGGPRSEAPPGEKLDLDRVAWTLQVGREPMEERLAVVASDAAQLSAALGRFAAGDEGGVLLGTPGSESRLRPSEPQPVGEAADTAALEALARRWSAGTEFDWDALYPSRPAPISLPSYPFAREHCWLPGAHVPAGQAPPAAAPAPPTPTASAGTADDREAPDAADPSRVEERVLSLLSDLTGYPPSELDPRLSFHAHGLDSLSLIRLADRLNAAYGLSLTPDTFLDATTPAALSALLRREHGAELRRTAEHETGRDREPASVPQPPAGPVPTPDRHPPAGSGPRTAPAPSPSPGSDPVVVVGMAGVMPDSPDLEAFWSNLESGGDLVSEVPADRWDWRAAYGDPSESPDRSRVHRGGFMPDVDGFDPLFFGISPREAAWMDPRQRLLLRTVWSAIEDAGIDPGELAGTRTGLFVGAGAAEYADLIRRSGVPVDAYASTGLTPSMLVNRISYHLDLRGPSEPVDTACSSSLVALHRAVEALEGGHCGTVIAGGVSLMLSPTGFAALEQAGMLSEDGVGRAFDRAASGYVRGEGVGAVVLKRLSDALSAGNPIHAVVRGTAVNHGGRANSLTAPNPRAQADVIVDAHLRAAVDPRTIGYVEAHGTGTVIGDPAEVNGLRQAFDRLYEHWGHPAPQEPHCALTALKNAIGHLEPAAGIAAFLRGLLALRHRRVPGNANVRELNGYLRLEGSPFHVPFESRPWADRRDPEGREQPRRLGISSFGYGGVNAHVVLEEYAGADPAAEPEPVVFALSARDPERLRAYARSFVSAPASPAGRSVPGAWASDPVRTAYTLQIGRPALAERLALVARDGEEIRSRLRDWLAGRSEGVLTGRVERGSTPPQLPEGEADPHAVAAAWVRGATVDWPALYRTVPGRRSLPTYPFAEERHWFAAGEPASGNAPPAAEAVPDDLLLFETEWRQAPSPRPAAAPFGGTTLVLSEDGAPALRLPGTTVTVRPGPAFADLGEDTYALHPDRPEEYARLVAALSARGRRVGRIVHLRAFSPNGAEHRSRYGPEPLFLLLKAVTSVDAAALERVQVATGAHEDPALAEAWAGFAGSLAAIAPGTEFSVIRFAGPCEESALRAELTADRLDAAVVRYEGTVRRTQHQRERRAAEWGTGAGPVLREHGVYLITGGMGGLGRLLARSLAVRKRPRLALLGRSPLDDAGRARLGELRDLGAEVAYHQADVADAARMAEVVDAVVSEWGALNGVFHLAGTVSGRPLPEKDLTELRAQLRPRIDGTRVLDEATGGQPLDVFVLYSSSSGHLGDFGLVDYAFGARYLDGFAEAREAARAAGLRGGRTVAVDWPMWRDGGMHVDPDDEQRYFASTGFRFLETEEAEHVLELALGAGTGRLLVVPGEPERVRAHVRASEAGTRRAGSSAARAPEPAAAPAEPAGAALRAAVVEELRRILTELLEAPAAALETDAAFGEYGLDSFGIKALSQRLDDRYGIDLPTTALFAANTLGKLGDRLVADHADELRTVHAPEAEEPAPERAATAPAHRSAEAPPAERGSTAEEPIAVIGMSGRFPGSPDLDAFWTHLDEGRDLIEEVPPGRWDWRKLADRFPGTPRWGGFLSDVDRFDPLFFRISPLEAEVMDPQHRLFLEESWKALEDAGCRPDSLAGRPVCVFVGTQFTDYESMVLGSGEPNAYAGAGLARTMLANRLSYLLDLRGPSESVDTACSSSLVALHRAVRSLRSGESELALAGGVSLVLSPETTVSAHQLGVLAPDGRCKTMDSRADGYVKGEGVAALLLKPLSRALADGDRVHGVIRGSAVNHGGHATSLTAPNPDAQADLLVAAYRDAAVPVETVSYVEMHGTGTDLGDPIEVDAVRQAWRRLSGDAAGTGYAAEVGLGTVKSNIGHLEPAAGVAGVVKVLLAMRNRRLPATLHVEELNPLVQVDGTPFAPVLAARDWQPRSADGAALVRRAGVSSFGFGGVNAHVVLEEAPEQSEPEEDEPQEPDLFVLSARNTERLRAYAAETASFLDREPSASLAALARTSRTGRTPMAARLAVVAEGTEQLRDTLGAFAASGSVAEVEGASFGTVEGPASGHAWTAEREGREYVRRMLRERRAERLAELWVSGVEIDWSQGPEARTRTVSLPTYPFARERYWLGGPGTADPPRAVEPAPAEQVFAKVWHAEGASGEPADALGAESVLVLVDPAGERLAREAFGAEASIVVLREEEDADPEAGSRIAARVLAGKPVDTVFDLVDTAEEASGEAPESWARIVLLQELLARFRRTGLSYLHLTRGLVTHEAERPTLRGAVFAGLVRTVPAEYRGVRARTVDVDGAALTPERLRAVLARELAADPGDAEVCVRRGVRNLPVLEPVPDGPSGADWRQGLGGAPVVITGGTGALGRAVAAELIAHGADRLVLMGRRALPERERWEELRSAPDTDPSLAERVRGLLALERPGVEVRVLSGQLEDGEWLRPALEAVRAEYGPIAGVVHCAGLGRNADPAFVGKRVADMRTVLAPKVAGVRELSAALADDPLRFFVLCSSVSGEIPVLGAGISDYALANSFLDRFAEYQAAVGRGCYRSLQWPSWRSMGMPEVTTGAYRDLGLETLSTEAGLGLLRRALAVPDRPVLMPCVTGSEAAGPERWLRLPTPAGTEPAAQPPAQLAAARPAAGPAGAPGEEDALLSRLAGVFAAQLRLTESQVGAETQFADLGVDSIMIAQLLVGVERELGVTVEPSAFLEHPTLARLAAHLRELGATAEQPDRGAPARPSGTPPADAHADAHAAPYTSPPAPAHARDSGKIAVIGLACHFPGAPDHETFWRNLATGTDSVTEVPRSRWDVDRHYAEHQEPGRSISKWGGFLPDIEEFDPAFFRISEEEAPLVDPLVRQFLEVAVECLHDAGIDHEKVAGRRTGVFAGSRTSNFGSHHADSGGSISGMAQNFIAAQVSHFLNVRGPAMVVDSACSSSLLSVHLAAQSLRAGECDTALAGGVEILLDQVPFVGMSEGRALSPTGRCRTFDERADGIVLGEGAGMLLLKRLEDAVRDGDPVRAVIDGSAVNNDGRTMGITTPNPEAQREVISDALRAAGVSAREVSYVEAHGTGTMIGDPMELRALTDVFRETTDETGFCGVGSVKTNVGHLLSASGIAGLIKVVLSLRHGQLPPTLHCERTNPRFRFDTSPFFPVRRLAEWRARGGTRRAGVSSFGFGGTNAHLLVSEPDPALLAGRPAPRAPLEPPRYRRTRHWFPAAGTPGEQPTPFLELRF